MGLAEDLLPDMAVIAVVPPVLLGFGEHEHRERKGVDGVQPGFT